MRPRAAARPSSASPAAKAPDTCYLCGSRALKLRFAARGERGGGAEAYRCTSFGHRQHPPIWACRDCGMVFQWPLRTEEELLAAYTDVEDPLYLEERENRYLTFRRVVKRLGPAKDRRLLDVGAYCGFFLDVAREAGFRAEGLELSTWAAAHARAMGFSVHSVPLRELAATAAYDVLTLWDVVEHFADPRAELTAAHRVLAPGGRLYLSTIDVGSLVARALGKSWPWLMEMHLFYFDRRTLGALLTQVGFRVVEVWNYTHIVSADYLLKKVGASFPSLASPLAHVRGLLPRQLPVPVNLGDNMVMVAERP